jgi:hypothetical protein
LRTYNDQGVDRDCTGADLLSCTGYGQYNGYGTFAMCAAACDACTGCTGFGLSNSGCWMKTTSATHALTNSQCYLLWPQPAASSSPPPPPLPPPSPSPPAFLTGDNLDEQCLLANAVAGVINYRYTMCFDASGLAGTVTQTSTNGTGVGSSWFIGHLQYSHGGTYAISAGDMCGAINAPRSGSLTIACGAATSLTAVESFTCVYNYVLVTKKACQSPPPLPAATVPTTRALPTTPPPESPFQWAHQGCFKESGSISQPRAIPNFLFSGSTIAACLAEARLRGYTTAALQFGGECYACSGCDWATYGAAADDACADPLGGEWANQVYLREVAPPPPFPPPLPPATVRAFAVASQDFLSHAAVVVSSGDVSLSVVVPRAEMVIDGGERFAFDGQPSGSSGTVNGIELAGFTTNMTFASISISCTARYVVQEGATIPVPGYSGNKYRHLFNFAGLTGVRARARC